MYSEALLMLIPLTVTLIYGEFSQLHAFLIPIFALIAAGFLVGLKAPKNGEIYARDGFAVVALSWIVLSLFGALPMVISGFIPNYVDSVFETVSGFTTTGASILTDIEIIPRGLLFWRSFTHWIGGMGVLVFIMAVLPLSGGRNMHIMRAEVPGPEVGKLVSKLSNTAKILYGIYMAMTLIEVVMLVAGGMPLYDAFIHSFGTAGTGGFSIMNKSIGHYNSLYFDIVIGVFMLLFGMNFNLYYLLLLRDFRSVWKSEEMRLYLGIVCASTVAIAVNLIHQLGQSVGSAFRYSFFQVSSIMTTTGYSTADFNSWPTFSKIILVLLMFIGACAGSTGGGIKVSRILILIKHAISEMRRLIHPRAVIPVRVDGKPVESRTVRGVYVFIGVYLILFNASVILLSLDPNVSTAHSSNLATSFTAVASCFNNIGPGLEIVGPTGNFAGFSMASKILLSFDMLLGRLEIFPILMVFVPNFWTRNKSLKTKRIAESGEEEQ